MRVGVEVGGTFTDLVWEHEGEVGVIKVPSTPARPDAGALEALDRLGSRLSELEDLVHGSTVATNAILERIPHQDLRRRLEGQLFPGEKL